MLTDYLPQILKDIREISLIMSDGDVENERLYTAIANLEYNQYVTTVNDEGMNRYENMLKITKKGTDSLEDRRFRVMALYNKQLPYTEKSLQRDLTSLCGADKYSLAIDYVNKVLTVKVALTAKEMFNIVGEYLETVVPLNMIINLLLLYNQYLLFEKYTYEQLGMFTYQAMREEVLS